MSTFSSESLRTSDWLNSLTQTLLTAVFYCRIAFTEVLAQNHQVTWQVVITHPLNLLNFTFISRVRTKALQLHRMYATPITNINNPFMNGAPRSIVPF